MRAPPSRPPERPLPESLTRFLAEPTARIDALHPPGRAGRKRAGPRRRNAALRIGLAWAILYNVVGAAILYWLWSGMGATMP